MLVYNCHGCQYLFIFCLLFWCWCLLAFDLIVVLAYCVKILCWWFSVTLILSHVFLLLPMSSHCFLKLMLAENFSLMFATEADFLLSCTNTPSLLFQFNYRSRFLVFHLTSIYNPGYFPFTHFFLSPHRLHATVI